MPPDDRKPTVLITGSSGFLGRAIADGLSDAYRVIGLDMVVPDGGPIETIEIDLTSDESVGRAIGEARERAGGDFASVIHLAAYYDTTGENDPKYESVTVQGTRRLLGALKRAGTEQLVFASTMLVHAPSLEKGDRIDEGSPIDPPWAYPASKARTEELVRKEHGEIDVVFMRPAGIYNEDCRAAFVAQQIARIFERRPTAYLFTGDIDTGQPYLHLDDLVDAVRRIVDRRGKLPPETALLLAEEETPTYREMQERIGRLCHDEDWPTLSLPKGMTKLGSWVQTSILDQETEIKPWMIEGSDAHYDVDISRARALLDWEPRHSLVDTLPEMIRRLKQDPTDWYEMNKLDPEVVAASAPELDQAERRLAGPLERTDAEVEAERERQYAATLWAPFANIGLGLWLVTSPAILGLFDPVSLPAPPALGHEIAEAQVRNTWLGISEIVSGTLVVILAAAGISRPRRWMQWLTASVGLWIMLAPLVFWTTSPAAYGLDTLIGMVVIAFAVMIPPAPGIATRALASDDDRPLGWTYSPSAFTQRLPIVALALVGLFVSRYLAAYQMGHVDGLWDPFFGPGGSEATNGSEAVVTSWVSKGFPIADAGLGAFAYGLDILAGAIGDRRRWRTMPWMVFLFGLLIIPLGVVSVSFIIIQPVLIGALCTLCIIQAAVTVVLIPYSVDEVLATLQYLRRATQAGEPFWRTFWRGGPALSEDQTPEPDLERSFGDVMREFVMGGVNFPWTLVVATGLGALLMATPLFMTVPTPLYHVNHVAGCVAILIAVSAMAEVVRPARFLNVPIGAGIAVAPFLIGGVSGSALVFGVVAGLALIALSLPRGRRSAEHYGAWDTAIV